MNIVSINRDSDTLGIIASALCLIHCLATPLLLIIPTTSVIFKEKHISWWSMLDLVFLSISFIAVYWSTKTTSKRKIKYAFWAGWLTLLLVVINEKIEMFPLPEMVIYPVTLSLVILHYYNKNYCKCKDEKCCNN